MTLNITITKRVADVLDKGGALTGEADLSGQLNSVFSGSKVLTNDEAINLAAQTSAWGFSTAATLGSLSGNVAASYTAAKGPLDVCAEEHLIDATGRYGHESHAPELWIYSENDQYFYPALAQRMYSAFTSAGGNVSFITAPPYSEDGHKYIRDIASWKPEVDAFLTKIGFLR